MSIKALSWALETTTGSPSCKLVLLYLADRYNDDERAAWPSVGTIARVTELSPRTVTRAIKQLLDEGIIEQAGWAGRRQDRQTKRYRLNMTNKKTACHSDTPRSERTDTVTLRPDTVTETTCHSDTRTNKEPLGTSLENIAKARAALKGKLTA